MGILYITLLTILAGGVGTLTGFGTSTIRVPILLFFLSLPQTLLLVISHQSKVKSRKSPNVVPAYRGQQVTVRLFIRCLFVPSPFQMSVPGPPEVIQQTPIYKVKIE